MSESTPLPYGGYLLRLLPYLQHAYASFLPGRSSPGPFKGALAAAGAARLPAPLVLQPAAWRPASSSK